MIKAFKITQEKELNKFLAKNPENKIYIDGDNILVDYLAEKDLIKPYRVVKFKATNLKLTSKIHEEIRLRFSKILFFDDFIKIGNIKLLHGGEVKGCYVTYFTEENKDMWHKVDEIYIWTTGTTGYGLSGIHFWNDGNFENSDIETFIDDFLECYLENKYVEVDEDYKYDKRTLAIASIGQNIVSGLEIVAGSINKHGDDVREGLGNVASSIAVSGRLVDQRAGEKRRAAMINN